MFIYLRQIEGEEEEEEVDSATQADSLLSEELHPGHKEVSRGLISGP